MKRLVCACLLITITVSLSPASTVTRHFHDEEILRDGSFAQNFDAWYERGSWSESMAVRGGRGPGGGNALLMPGTTIDVANAPTVAQQLFLPANLTALHITGKVRVAPRYEDGTPPQPGDTINAFIGLTGLLADGLPNWDDLLLGTFFFDPFAAELTDWLDFAFELDADALAQLNARDPALRTGLAIATWSPTWRLAMEFTDLSVTVSGSTTHPELAGRIAYWDGREIRLTNPNGGEHRTVWRHPDPTGVVRDIRWHPNGTEIGFISDHHTYQSLFREDIYAIRPDGGGERRLTNGASPDQIRQFPFGRGRVVLNIFNNHTSTPLAFFGIHIQGADASQVITLDGQPNTTQVIFEDVAALDGPQEVVFIYTAPGCAGANIREVGGFVTVVPGETVTLNLTFNATQCGVSVPGTHSLSWKRDGSEIAYVLGALAMRIPTDGSSSVGQTFWSSGELLSGRIAWSPVDDRVLYDIFSEGAFVRDRIRLRDGGTGATAALDLGPQSGWGGGPQVPEWLPDGSALLFVDGGDLWIASPDAPPANDGRQRILGLPIGDRVERAVPSPDGQFLLLERRLGERRTLWIMDRARPNHIWFFGEGTLAHWSPAHVGDPVDPYAAWADAFGLTGPDRAPTADPGKQGLANLLAFHLGRDPRGGGPGAPALTYGGRTPPGGWIFHFYTPTLLRGVRPPPRVQAAARPDGFTAEPLPATVWVDHEENGWLRWRVHLTSPTDGFFLRLVAD